MTKKVICPIVTLPAFKNLESRLGDKSLTYTVWHEVKGNVAENGVPYLGGFMKLNPELRQVVLNSLSEEERAVALQNIEKEEARMLKLDPLALTKKARRDFSYTVKTSDNKTLSLREKTAAMDAIVYDVAMALLNQSQASVVDVFGRSRAFIEDLRMKRIAKIDELEKKAKLDADEETILKVAKISVRSYNKILDPLAWDQLQVNAKYQLELNGIRFRTRSKSRLKHQINTSSTQELAIDSNAVSVENANTEDAVESSFDKDDTLGRDPKDYSSSQIKAMMMGIVDQGNNNLGIKTLYDQSRVYKEVLMVLTAQNDFSEKGIMEALRKESLNHLNPRLL